MEKPVTRDVGILLDKRKEKEEPEILPPISRSMKCYNQSDHLLVSNEVFEQLLGLGRSWSQNSLMGRYHKNVGKLWQLPHTKDLLAQSLQFQTCLWHNRV